MPAESAVRLQTHEKEEEQPCKPPMSDMSPPPLLPGSPKVPPRAPITGTISSPPLQMRSTRRLAPVHRARHLRASDPGRVEENVVANRAEVGELETRYRAGGLGDTTLERRLEGVLESLLAPMHAGRSEMAEDPGVVEELLRAATARTREAAASVLRDLWPVFRLDRAWPLE